MIKNKTRHWRKIRSYEPENTWDRHFSYSTTQNTKGNNEPWWYDEK